MRSLKYSAVLKMLVPVRWSCTPNHDGIPIALAKLGHPSSSTSTMYHSEDCVVSHSITCSSDPFFRDVAGRKLAVAGRQCEKNNNNRARISGKCTLEHIQSTARTDNCTKSYPKFPWLVFFGVHSISLCYQEKSLIKLIPSS